MLGFDRLQIREAVLESRRGLVLVVRHGSLLMAHSCERAQVSGKQRYSRGFGRRNPAISRKSVGKRPPHGANRIGIGSPKFCASRGLPSGGLNAARLSSSCEPCDPTRVLRSPSFDDTACLPGCSRLLAVSYSQVSCWQAARCAPKRRPRRPDLRRSSSSISPKGPPNSCGPGCDRWIAVEGKVDQEAAARIRRFLRDVKDTQRPIYFHSPGGAVEQSFAIGRLLRSRKAIARVGRTIVAACAAGTQIDDACLKIKTAGGEVEAEITTHHAMCNSACGYLFPWGDHPRGRARCRDGRP